MPFMFAHAIVTDRWGGNSRMLRIDYLGTDHDWGNRFLTDDRRGGSSNGSAGKAFSCAHLRRP
jgi:hypothetical protein